MTDYQGKHRREAGALSPRLKQHLAEMAQARAQIVQVETKSPRLPRPAERLRDTRKES